MWLHNRDNPRHQLAQDSIIGVFKKKPIKQKSQLNAWIPVQMQEH